MIPMDKEKVECCNTGCIDQAVATWSSNIDPEDITPRVAFLKKDFRLLSVRRWSDNTASTSPTRNLPKPRSKIRQITKNQKQYQP